MRQLLLLTAGVESGRLYESVPNVLQGHKIHWVTSLFDLPFCWAKVRSKIRLKSKKWSSFAETL